MQKDTIGLIFPHISIHKQLNNTFCGVTNESKRPLSEL